jgi:hypothetical protein
VIEARILGLSCVVLAACGPEKFDVVARAAAEHDAGMSGQDDAEAGADSKECCSDAGVPADIADASGGSRNACAPGAETIELLTKAGRIYRVHAESGKLQERGVPTCLPEGDSRAAVDGSGRLWVWPADGFLRIIEADSLNCRRIEQKMPQPTALAFVYHPELQRELLYTLQAGELWEIDPATFASISRGKLEQPWLSGTADGRLVALSDRFGGVIEIGEVTTDAASYTPEWKVIPPPAVPFSGGTVQSNGFALIFGASLYRFRIGETNPQLVAPLFPEDPGIVAVAGPACALLPK